MGTVLRILLFVVLTASAWGAPSVEKVEPPSWWIGHTWNPVQLLLTGADLRNATVTAGTPAVRPRVQRWSEDGRYLFLSVEVPPDAKPGKHPIRVATRSGATSFEFELRPPVLTQGAFQGFGPDDVVYLIVPDRFADGNGDNNSPTGSRPAERTDRKFYHGGDFAGIRQRLPYLKELGVTGLWLLPVYQNSRAGKTPGYFYGYEPVDWYDVESRYGSMQELRALVDDAHRLGIKVMQDQVANHCGPAHPWAENPPTPTWFHDFTRRPRLVNNFDIRSLTDPYARPRARDIPLRGWFAGNLPDFDQDDALVRDYLIQNSLWWIGSTGVDGVRLDTYPYVDRRFWERWQSAVNRQFPSLFVVGEVTADSPAALSYFEGGERREGVDTKLSSLLDFPLFRAMRRVFGRGEPLTQLTDVLAQDFLYRKPRNLVAFFDNHDSARFLSLAGGEVSRLLMAQTFLLTTVRIPQLFYGDEVAIGADDNEDRRTTAADFPGGFPGDRMDAFTPAGRQGDAAAVYDHLRALLAFRKEHAALRTGRLVNLVAEQNRYVYLRTNGREHVLVVLRTRADTAPLSMDVSDVGLREGLVFRHWRGSSPGATLRGGRLTLTEAGNADIYWAADSL